MKRICIYLIVLLSTSSFGQINLIQNGDFEQFDTCPNYYNQMKYCIGWRSASDSTVAQQTPDFWNSCSSNPNTSPPTVEVGYQIPHSGNGYCGIACFASPGAPAQNVREYIQADLIDTLIQGVKYYVSLYANLSGGAQIYSYASNKLGALFTSYKFGNGVFASPNNFAHVYSDSILSDSINWFHFKATFIADSNYRYMTIGNFFDDAHTDTINLNPGYAYLSYYYIDDVCVSTDSNLCYTWNGISDLHFEKEDIYPNPADDVIHLNYKSKYNSPLIVYNTLGEIVLTSELNEFNQCIKCSSWKDGLYFIKLNYDIFKIVIQH